MPQTRDYVDVHTVCGKIVTRSDKRGKRMCFKCGCEIEETAVKRVPRADDPTTQFAISNAE